KMAQPQTGPFDDALERPDWDRLVAMHRDDYLPAIRMPPFLVTASLTNLIEAIPAQGPNDFFGSLNGIPFAHVSATSNTLAPADRLTGAGSNQSSRASFAFWIASSSVSPAE